MTCHSHTCIRDNLESLECMAEMAWNHATSQTLVPDLLLCVTYDFPFVLSGERGGGGWVYSGPGRSPAETTSPASQHSGLTRVHL